MAHFSKTLADQLGPFGINVTCIHPGTTLTERSMPMYREQAEREGISTEAVVERVSKGIGIRKIVEAKELAYLAAFLASPRSVAVNGEVISAGGGTVGVFYQ
jgi:NAD(P)-dependent dehydrogenase (short-subunit alcohol dehydrogenase family)